MAYHLVLKKILPSIIIIIATHEGEIIKGYGMKFCSKKNFILHELAISMQLPFYCVAILKEETLYKSKTVTLHPPKTFNMVESHSADEL